LERLFKTEFERPTNLLLDMFPLKKRIGQSLKRYGKREKRQQKDGATKRKIMGAERTIERFIKNTF
jgi:hypothetical protein